MHTLWPASRMGLHSTRTSGDIPQIWRVITQTAWRSQPGRFYVVFFGDFLMARPRQAAAAAAAAAATSMGRWRCLDVSFSLPAIIQTPAPAERQPRHRVVLVSDGGKARCFWGEWRSSDLLEDTRCCVCVHQSLGETVKVCAFVA